MEAIEKLANDYISQALDVKVSMYDNVEEAGDNVTRTRGFPVDLAGPLRVITIGDIDSNFCCGTHVKNLSELQVIKFLNYEECKGKKMLHFLVGDRVIKKFEEMFDRELAFNILLK
jgi:misacylated tRNA(Ala) deacylase